MNEPVFRRTVIRLSGAVGIAALAGCGGPGDEEDEAQPEDETEDAGEWEGVDEFRFEGRTQAWTGVEPGFLAGEENPTITLIDGNEYDFTWENADGVTHNLEIRDEDDNIVDDYQSEDLSDEGEETTVEGVIASEEMVVYICAYHEATQVGDIEVQTE
ncbi:hypothetical protein SAMN04515672_3839 [Natronorubrum texcoconense]|uniref:Uncharacterized protein n=2 Tax=Natronorubrum texcoconense TaxID=1095776 RepID=A0A1G9EBE0_9EURY|nr:PKD domain-containing protein [Natronorubrum texcoconense]SDK73406.1 hypothetical protein SAMN04515672_3839 [Natronorubrum texcoconense]